MSSTITYRLYRSPTDAEYVVKHVEPFIEYGTNANIKYNTYALKWWRPSHARTLVNTEYTEWCTADGVQMPGGTTFVREVPADEISRIMILSGDF